MNPNALEQRIFKHKKSTLDFICPLCGTERAFTLKPQIRFKNYMHMFLITVVIVMSLFPWMGFKSAWSFFMVWGIYECALRMLYRKQIPCPHCGFDASWYQRDVKVARRKVEKFWQDKTPISDEPEIQDENLDINMQQMNSETSSEDSINY